MVRADRTGAGTRGSPEIAYVVPTQYDETRRLAALYSYNILDTPVEPAFDDITKLAAFVCRSPIAMVTLIDRDRQWFKSEIGLGVRETPRDISICAHAIHRPDLFVVTDTWLDPRFASNPLVAGPPHLRFYAGVPLRTPAGQTLGTLCVLDHRPRRLTAEQRAMLQALAHQAMAQLELRRTLANTARLNHYRSRIMATAGHDLKQPLQVIAMLLDLLDEHLPEPGDRQRIARMNIAIDSIGAGLDALAGASVEPADTNLSLLGEVSLRSVLRGLAGTWQHHAERKKLKLRIVESSARVFSESAMLSTILGNLIGNAIKYTEHGGVLIGCRRRGTVVALEIVDTGCGIPADALDAIFTTFHQLQPDSEGLGLGLSIVAQTAQLLGHAIRVSSVVGKGSRFSIELPLVPNRRAPRTERTA